MRKIAFDLRERLLSPVTTISWFASSVACAIAGPFNTYEIDTLSFRIVFWSSILLVSVVMSNAIQVTLLHLKPHWPSRPLAAVSCAAFTLVYWVFIMATLRFVYGPVSLPHPIVLLGFIAGVSASIYIALFYVKLGLLRVTQPKEMGTRQAHDGLNPALNPFMQRLGLGAGDRLIRLVMRDHYIEAYTERGQRTLHMRFADAVRELNGFNGDQIHRSHWVNFDEVTQVVREGGKIGFQMSDGFVVPIARSRKPELKQRGLI